MLPKEVLVNIANCLSREDIEALQLVCNGMAEIVKRDFSESPLRFVDELVVDYFGTFQFKIKQHVRFRCDNPQTFEEFMHRCVVGSFA